MPGICKAVAAVQYLDDLFLIYSFYAFFGNFGRLKVEGPVGSGQRFGLAEGILEISYMVAVMPSFAPTWSRTLKLRVFKVGAKRSRLRMSGSWAPRMQSQDFLLAGTPSCSDGLYLLAILVGRILACLPSACSLAITWRDSSKDRTLTAPLAATLAHSAASATFHSSRSWGLSFLRFTSSCPFLKT